MKIAIIITKFDLVGGSELAALNIARNLVKYGHTVHVITSNPKKLKTEEIVEGFFVHRYPYIKIPILSFFSIILFSLMLIKKNRNEIDIIHAQSLSPSGLIAVLAKKIFNIPVVVKGVGSDVYLAGWFARNFILKFVIKNANIVLSLGGNDMKKRINEIYKRDIISFPDGIDLEKFQIHVNKSKKKRIKLELNIKDEKVILFVGRLVKVKGLENLLEAFEKIKNKRLLIIGDGEERNKLTEYCKNKGITNVNFLGKIDNQELKYYYSISDVFILPSLSESFGLVILEAMSLGVPVIASRVGAIPEILGEGKYGLLIKPGDSEDILNAITKLTSDDNIRKKFSELSFERSREFDWDKIIKRLVKVYREIINDTNL